MYAALMLAIATLAAFGATLFARKQQKAYGLQKIFTGYNLGFVIALLLIMMSLGRAVDLLFDTLWIQLVVFLSLSVVLSFASKIILHRYVWKEPIEWE